MGYCTAAELAEGIAETTLIQLTDPDGAAVDNAVVDQAITKASRMMDTYLGGRYALPISGTIPPILKSINADLAVYLLYAAIMEEIPQTRTDQRKNAVKLLEDIRDGKLAIGLQPPPTAVQSDNYEGASKVTVRDKDFDTTTMGKY